MTYIRSVRKEEKVSFLVARAAAFAHKAHAGHVRKYTGEPYFNHLAEVARIVAATPGSDEAMVAAAYLHDTLEDTPTTYADLVKEFGHEVAVLVAELTNIRTEGNRATRKARDRARLAGISERAMTIKLADLIHNTGDIVEFDPKFAKLWLAEKTALLAVMTGGDPELRKRAA